MAVEQKIVKTPIKYKRNDDKEALELEKNLKERDEALGKAKAEAEDIAETESLPPEEKTFKKRYGDLRRHSQEKRMKLIAEREAQSTRAMAEAELMRIHPDFETIRNDQEFHDWVELQPRWVQQALYENESDSKSAARAIDLYKVDMGITSTPKKKADPSKDAAKAVTRGSSNTPSATKSGQANQIKESDVAKMKPHEFEKNEEKIKEAIASGNFIYDMTRRA